MEVAETSGSLASEGAQIELLVWVCRQRPEYLQQLGERLANETPVVVRGVSFQLSAMFQAIHRLAPDSEVLAAFPHFSGSTTTAASSPSGSAASTIFAGAVAAVATPPPISSESATADVAGTVVAAGPAQDAAAVPPHVFERVGFADVLQVVWDVADSQWVLVHLTTGERVGLPATPSEWLLFVDDDDGAAVVEVVDNDPRVLDVDDLFHCRVWRAAPDGRLIVKSEFDGAESTTWLSEHLAVHQNVQLHIPCASSSAIDTLTAYVFAIPRAACRVYISLASLLQALGIQRSGKTLGTYLCHQFAAWGRASEQYMVQGLLASQVYDKSGQRPDDADLRVLREKTCSSCLALVLLSRWAWCSRQQGGLDSKEEQAAANHLLSRLLQDLHRSGVFDIVVCTSGSIGRNVLGLPTGGAAAVLHVGTDGLVDLHSLIELRRSPGHASSWIRQIDIKFGVPVVPLMDLLEWLVRDAFPRARPRLLPLQFLWGLGLALDKRLAGAVGRNTERTGAVLVSVSEQTVPQELLVALYHQGVAEMARLAGPRFLSGAVDKSRVHSYGLMNGAYALPDNTCFWAVPQDWLIFGHRACCCCRGVIQEQKKTLWPTQDILGTSILGIR